MLETDQINRQAFSYYARLRRVKRFVDSHYGDPISLSRAAGVAGVERKYFSSFFHQKTGICFRDWLAHVRINRAVALMRENNHSMTHIAHAVGFGNLRSFERAFKKWRGTTPHAFKKAVRPC